MVQHKPAIRFHILHEIRLRERKRLRAFLTRQVTAEGFNLLELDYIFCDDSYLLKINQTYLQHDELTDIITFDLSDLKKSVKGEIYISVERVRENASLFKAGVNVELHRVVFHGILHLLGYSDKSPTSKKRMTAKEDEWLLAYFRRQSEKGAVRKV